MQPMYHEVHFYCCETNFTIINYVKDTITLSFSDLNVEWVTSTTRVSCSPQTLTHINGSTLILTYCPPMTKSHCSTKHGNRIRRKHHLYSGTPLNYTWTCPNGPCEVEGYYGRKVYNEHILAVNTTSHSQRASKYINMKY